MNVTSSPFSICTSATSMVMNVPDLPIPALQWTSSGPCTRNRWLNLIHYKEIINTVTGESFICVGIKFPDFPKFYTFMNI